MTTTETIHLIKEIFNNTIENMQATDATYARYFSEDYVQHVDGKTLTYQDFVVHMRALKKAMKSISVTFKHILVDADKVATVHVVNGIKQDNQPIEVQVNAIFQLRDKKLILCDELTHLIKGDKTDTDLGSRV